MLDCSAPEKEGREMDTIIHRRSNIKQLEKK